MAVDMDQLNASIGRLVVDLSTMVCAGMEVMGERLGMYKALAKRVGIRS
jgi:hypothetical protein